MSDTGYQMPDTGFSPPFLGRGQGWGKYFFQKKLTFVKKYHIIAESF